MRFENWYFLFLVPLIIYIFVIRKKKKSFLKFSSVKLLKSSGLKKTFKHKIGRYLITAGLIMATIALARPQLTQEALPINQRGIDIAMVLDVSGTMQSVDITPNRLEAAKKTIQDFIQQRPNDRISLIIFGGTAYTQIPLTLDHNILREAVGEINFESINEGGSTAIGTAISVGLNRLKKSDASSKVIVLLTDGDNNAGSINPDTAAELSKEMGVRIYTIGIGTDTTKYAVNDPFGGTMYQQGQGDLNEELLNKIAETTGGQYNRARDSEALSEIFSKINQLEKTKFAQDNFRQYDELAFIFIIAALILLLAGIFLERFYYIHIP
jgi:Ca-activated chloride channel family protein